MIIAYSTTPNETIAKEIADYLIDKKLAACVSLIPNIKSIYRWENKIVEDNEILLMIKSDQAKQQTLIDTIVKLHPYDTPEIIIVPIENGFKGYLDWIKSALD